MTSWQVIEGDCREVLASLDAESVHTCITSPPYWALRDYGHDGQLGLEPTPDEYVASLVEVFRGVRRVLREDGTLWLNLGDSYCNRPTGRDDVSDARWAGGVGSNQKAQRGPLRHMRVHGTGLKPKDLIGLPWMVAFALRADGWWLRQEIIWHKRSPMPDPVTDRCTRSHEQVFMLTRSPRYFYDAAAIAEDAISDKPSGNSYARPESLSRNGRGQPLGWTGVGGKRNRRTVWTLSSQPYRAAHFATFPPKLVEPCVLAGAPEGGMVLDPFAGAGTTGIVAARHGRSFVGVELNPEYAEMARRRIRDDAPLLNMVSEAVSEAGGRSADVSSATGSEAA